MKQRELEVLFHLELLQLVPEMTVYSSQVLLEPQQVVLVF